MKPVQLPKTNRQQKQKMLPLILVAFFMLVLSGFSNQASAQVNLVVNTPLCFKDMDNNALYDEDLVAGQITVNSLLIQTGGSISYNDPGSPCGDVGVPNDPAGAIRIIVTNDFEMQNGGAIYTENRIQSGEGGDITLTVGGTFVMRIGSLISSSNLTATSGDRSAGNIKINVVGNIVMDAGSEIRANSAHGNGGDIEMTSQNNITINGHINSKDLSNQSGSGTNQAHGGFIFIQAAINLFIGDDGIVSSRGFDAGADLVHLCACQVTIYGLVESTATGHGVPSDPPNHLNGTFRPDKSPNSTAGVEIWASTSIIIDNLNHNGEVNADLCCGGGTTGESWIDIFSKTGDITIIGKNDPDNLNIQVTNFAVHANGAAGNSDNGGTVTIKALNGKVTASGLAVQADGTKDGGKITVEAKGDVNLSGGKMTARGYKVATTTGGQIDVRSYGTVAPAGSIVATASSVLDVTGDAGNVVNLTACGTVDFPPGTVVGAVPTILTPVCGGNPSLASQPYVQFCGTVGNLTITKILNGFTAQNTPANDWSFTVNPAINGISNFTIPKDLVPNNNYVFTNVPAGNYTITETLQADPSCVQATNYVVTNTVNGGSQTNSNVANVTVESCLESTVTFINTPPTCNRDASCQWCNKGAVLSQVWQNPGNMDPTQKCVVPDILVDVTMAHGGANDVVDASEIHTGQPATWSIQAAIDYVNAHYNDIPFPFDDSRELFIGVTATQPIAADPLDPNSCGKTCVRPYAGDNPYGTENVIVTNSTTARLNIFGCSVTMWPAVASEPVFTVVQSCTGKITILDLHVKYSTAAGYLILPPPSGCSGVGELVVVKNSSAWYNNKGYDVQASKVEITGAQHIYGNTIGVLVSGSNVKLRTNSDIIHNTVAGIKITGNGNETNGNEVGTSGHPNALGIWVTGNNNNLHDDEANYNTGNGIYITGNNNIVHQEEASYNGQYGILIPSSASGNTLDGNDADGNGKQGIRACGQIDGGGNNGEDNAEDPQVSFSCPDVSATKFSVVDISADKKYKYDATFNLISSATLTANNSDGNDITADATYNYVLDKSDKQVYRYVGSTVASKVLKSSSGGSLSSPSGMAIDGDQLWVVDGSNKIIYRYSLAAAFAGSGNLNALQQITLTGNNANAEGLAIDATYLYVLDNADKQFYRYPRAGGAGVASKVLKDPGGSSLGTPTGAVKDGTDMWIVDKDKDKAYRYVFANLGFGVAGNLNASSQYALYGANANATGIAVGTSGTLLRTTDITTPVTNAKNESLEMAPKSSIDVKELYLQVYPNPAHSNVLVRFSSPGFIKYKLNLVDAVGRTVMSYNGVTADGLTSHEFNVSNLAKGSYTLVLEKAGMKKEVKKIIVN